MQSDNQCIASLGHVRTKLQLVLSVNDSLTQQPDMRALVRIELRLVTHMGSIKTGWINISRTIDHPRQRLNLIMNIIQSPHTALPAGIYQIYTDNKMDTIVLPPTAPGEIVAGKGGPTDVVSGYLFLEYCVFRP